MANAICLVVTKYNIYLINPPAFSWQFKYVRPFVITMHERVNPIKTVGGGRMTFALVLNICDISSNLCAQFGQKN